MRRNDYGELAVMVGNQEPTKLLSILGVEVVVRAKRDSSRGASKFPGGPAW